MSIYGGFPTRALESSYNTYLCDILHTLQTLLLSLLQSKKNFEIESLSEKFCFSYSKIVKLEQQKHLLPKFSDYIKDLDEYLRPTITESRFDKSSERISIQNISTPSLAKSSNNTSSRFYNLRQTSVPGKKTRKNSNIIQKNSGKKGLTIQVKDYQDKILKSILKELSDPFEF